ncbi:MAG: hypothetical protein ACKOB3_02605 [Holophagaceae bacterium]
MKKLKSIGQKVLEFLWASHNHLTPRVTTKPVDWNVKSMEHNTDCFQAFMAVNEHGVREVFLSETGEPCLEETRISDDPSQQNKVNESGGVSIGKGETKIARPPDGPTSET